MGDRGAVEALAPSEIGDLPLARRECGHRLGDDLHQFGAAVLFGHIVVSRGFVISRGGLCVAARDGVAIPRVEGRVANGAGQVGAHVPRDDELAAHEPELCEHIVDDVCRQLRTADISGGAPQERRPIREIEGLEGSLVIATANRFPPLQVFVQRVRQGVCFVTHWAECGSSERYVTDATISCDLVRRHQHNSAAYAVSNKIAVLLAPYQKNTVAA